MMVSVDYVIKRSSYYKKIANNKKFKWLDIANNPKDLKEFNIKQSDALLYLHAFDSKINNISELMLYFNLEKSNLLEIFSFYCVSSNN